MTEWDLQPRASACTTCHQPFPDKSRYHTLLAYAAGVYTRRDLCAACFARADRSNVVSYWQGEYKMPPPPPPEPIQRENAESLLRKLLASPEPAHGPARYILAVMLERKRILKHRDTIRTAEGQNVLIYEHRETGESLQIPDPNLRLDQLGEIQEQILRLLESPVAGPATAEPASDPAAAVMPADRPIN